MKPNAQILTLLLAILVLVRITHQHGYLQDPPARNCAWRFGFATPVNYDDNGLNCGGFMDQWENNDGKCGICGDSYSGERHHEAGGKYATGTIVRSFTIGQEIDATVYLTANHLGRMEFRLCPVNDKLVRATQECLDQNQLEIVNYGMSYPVREGEREINIRLKLPEDVTCSQCVLQWKYVGGNNWGQKSSQEEFYNCADIEITDSESPPSLIETTIKSTQRATKPVRTTKRRTKATKTTTTTTMTSSSVKVEPVAHEDQDCKRIPAKLVPQLVLKFKDPYEFHGKPVCFLLGDTSTTCIECYEKCISPFRKCPRRDCLCKWYPDLK